MTEKSLRISADVLCSTNQNVLTGWKRSSDELLIWRRPNFDTPAIQNYIDDIAVNNLAHFDALHKTHFYFNPHDMTIWPADIDELDGSPLLNIPFGSLKLSNLFPGPLALPLIEDIETRLSEDSQIVFPNTKALKLAIRTKTVTHDEGFHIDHTPILGYSMDRLATQYIKSNLDINESKQAIPRKRVTLEEDIPANSIQTLQPGDVVVMKHKPHRTMATKTPQHRLWLGVYKF